MQREANNLHQLAVHFWDIDAYFIVKRIVGKCRLHSEGKNDRQGNKNGYTLHGFFLCV